MSVETSEFLYSNRSTTKGPDIGLHTSQALGAGEEKMLAPEFSPEMVRFSQMVLPFIDEVGFTMFNIRSRFAQSAVTGDLSDVKDLIKYSANPSRRNGDEHTPHVRLKNIGNAAVRIDVPCLNVWVSRSDYLAGEELERQLWTRNIQIAGENWEYFFDKETSSIPQGVRFYLDPVERYTIIPHAGAITHSANGYHHGRDSINNHIMKIPRGNKTPFLLAQTADVVTFSENVHGVIQGVGSREGVLDGDIFHLQSLMIEGGNTNFHALKVEVKDSAHGPLVDSVDIKFLPA